MAERAPAHQIQLYSIYGLFLKKFGSELLQHPRCVAVDARGRIFVVESKTVRLNIFDDNGMPINVIFSGSTLPFPTGITVDHREHIYVCDNRTHGVHKFDMAGRQVSVIGDRTSLNFPISVRLTSNGSILIAENYKYFRLTLFSLEGDRIKSFESKVRHSKCFDVAVFNDNFVVVSSDDGHCYIYSLAEVK